MNDVERLSDIKIGEWVCITENGMQESIFGDKGFSWKSKRELIKDIGDMRMDAAKKPRVKRLGTGYYLYTIKDCDTLHYTDTYSIVCITAQNIDEYKNKIRKQIENENDY